MLPSTASRTFGEGKLQNSDSFEGAQSIAAISRVIERCGDAAHGEAHPEEAARAWIEAGFDDAEEVEAWLAARCFTAAGAQALERAGITPEQASLRTRAGTGDYEETIGYKLSNGDLDFDEARRIITREFWD